jgi:hypothetical protein
MQLYSSLSARPVRVDGLSTSRVSPPGPLSLSTGLMDTHLDVRVAHSGVIPAHKLQLAERQVVHLRAVRPCRHAAAALSSSMGV